MISGILDTPDEDAPASLQQRFAGFIGFDERMASLMSMWPLYGLTAKNTLTGYTGFELGVCLLLFVMEKMLRYETCTYEDARDFLGELLPCLPMSLLRPNRRRLWLTSC